MHYILQLKRFHHENHLNNLKIIADNRLLLIYDLAHIRTLLRIMVLSANGKINWHCLRECYHWYLSIK